MKTRVRCVGLADNLTETLSIHIFQEPELLEQGAALRATIGNFLTRACVAATLVALMVLLSGYFVAKTRGVSVTPELIKHIALAAVVIVASGLIGNRIGIFIN